MSDRERFKREEEYMEEMSVRGREREREQGKELKMQVSEKDTRREDEMS